MDNSNERSSNYRSEWVKKHPNYMKDYLKEWKSRHKEKQRHYKKIWNKKHPNYQSEWINKHPNYMKSYLKEWRSNVKRINAGGHIKFEDVDLVFAILDAFNGSFNNMCTSY